MFKTVAAIFALIVVGCLVLYSLILASERSVSEKNGFKRNISQNYLRDSPVGKAPNSNSLELICGASNTQLYFSGNNPLNIKFSDLGLQKISSIDLPLKLHKVWLTGYDIFVDSLNVRLYSRNTSKVLFYSLKDSSYKIIKLAPPLFTRVAPISSNTVAMRAFDTSQQKQIFQKISLITGEVLKQNEIFETRYDAGFSTDGYLHYDSTTNRIMYMQFYQNRLYCLDTNLNLLYQAKTIDTFNTNPIHTRKFSGENERGSLMPSVPLKVVNRACFVNQGKMYVISNVRADNENRQDFSNNSVVDIYNITNGTYESSFYIPNSGKERVIEVKIVKNILIAIYKSSIVTFKINFT